MSGISCVYIDVTETIVKCFKDGYFNDVCGSDYGVCMDGLICIVENEGDIVGFCTDFCKE